MIRENSQIYINIIAHNEEKVIADTIASVKKQNFGDLGKIEIHIFTNGCTDNTEKIVQSISDSDPTVFLHSTDAKGKVRSLKESISYYHNRFTDDPESRSEYIFYTDADIEFPAEDILSNLTDILVNDDNLYLVSSYPAMSSIKDNNSDFVSSLFRTRHLLHRTFHINMIRAACYVIKWDILNQLEIPDELLSDDMFYEVALTGHFYMSYDNYIITELKHSLEAEIRRDLFHLIAREQVYYWSRKDMIKRIKPDEGDQKYRLSVQDSGNYIKFLLKRFDFKAIWLLYKWNKIHKANEAEARKIFYESLEKDIDLLTYWSTER